MKTELRYNFNYSTLGIPEAIGEQTDIREPDLPFQEISSHILSSKSDFFFGQSSLNIILGYINNSRKEFEDDTNIPALFMKLNTLSYNLQYQLAQMGKFETIVGIQGMEQQNENFGEELLIPNAKVSDLGILSTAHFHLDEANDFQFGLRYDFRTINTESYQADNSPTTVEAIDRTFGSFNAAFGYKAIINEFLVSRINLASGFRAPNLSELASNGVHEGTNRYEIGNPDLENERNIQIDLSLEYKNEHLELFANAFYNKVKDFIFIAPTATTIDNNAVFMYEQENASLYGGEIGVHLHPHPLDWLHLESSYEVVVGKQENNDYLPLIPANTMTNTLRVEFQKKASWLQERYSFITLKSRAKQNNITDFETETPAYSLLSIGAGGLINVGTTSVTARLTATNVLNKSYISHLSRLKADNIENIGRNINLALEIPL
jgi:iron complex outermembrane receptor protein